jgi:hypothetical protein
VWAAQGATASKELLLGAPARREPALRRHPTSTVLRYRGRSPQQVLGGFRTVV